MHGEHLFVNRPRFVVLTFSNVEAQSASWTAKYLNEAVPGDYRVHTFQRTADSGLEILLERTTVS